MKRRTESIMALLLSLVLMTSCGNNEVVSSKPMDKNAGIEMTGQTNGTESVENTEMQEKRDDGYETSEQGETVVEGGSEGSEKTADIDSSIESESTLTHESVAFSDDEADASNNGIGFKTSVEE